MDFYMLSSFRLIPVTAIFFFGFILWIIVISDMGGSNVLIDSVRAVPYGDKFGHMSLYAVLALLVNLSLKPRKQRYLGLPFGCALVLLFALLEELSQYFFPTTRMLDIQDALADIAGVYLAAWVCEKWKMNIKSK
jgi:polysaccharide biosynthesis protein VpsQ